MPAEAILGTLHVGFMSLAATLTDAEKTSAGSTLVSPLAASGSLALGTQTTRNACRLRPGITFRPVATSTTGRVFNPFGSSLLWT